MIEPEDDPRPPLSVTLRRVMARRCPRCGEAPLFSSYIKQVNRCAACGEALGHIRSDDAAPWLTILIVGHIIVPLLLSVEKDGFWPTWLSMTVWPLLALALTLAVLPLAKALFIGVIWGLKATGSEPDETKPG